MFCCADRDLSRSLLGLLGRAWLFMCEGVASRAMSGLELVSKFYDVHVHA